MKSHDDEDDAPPPIPPPIPYPAEEALEDAIAGRASSKVELPEPERDPFDEGKELAEVEPVPPGITDLLRGLAKWQVKYCLALLDTIGVQERAASIARVSNHIVRKNIAENPYFAAAVNECMDQCKGIAKSALVQSAIMGVPQPVFQGGLLVGYKRVRDIRALELHLRATNPEEFGESAGQKPAHTAPVVDADRLAELVAGGMQRLFDAQNRISAQREKIAQAREV